MEFDSDRNSHYVTSGIEIADNRSNYSNHSDPSGRSHKRKNHYEPQEVNDGREESKGPRSSGRVLFNVD